MGVNKDDLQESATSILSVLEEANIIRKNESFSLGEELSFDTSQSESSDGSKYDATTFKNSGRKENESIDHSQNKMDESKEISIDHGGKALSSPPSLIAAKGSCDHTENDLDARIATKKLEAKQKKSTGSDKKRGNREARQKRKTKSETKNVVQSQSNAGGESRNNSSPYDGLDLSECDGLDSAAFEDDQTVDRTKSKNADRRHKSLRHKEKRKKATKKRDPKSLSLIENRTKKKGKGSTANNTQKEISCNNISDESDLVTHITARMKANEREKIFSTDDNQKERTLRWEEVQAVIEPNPSDPFSSSSFGEDDDVVENRANKAPIALVSEGQSMARLKAIELSPPIPFNPLLVEDDDDAKRRVEEVQIAPISEGQSMGQVEAIGLSPPVPFNPLLVEEDDDDEVKTRAKEETSSKTSEWRAREEAIRPSPPIPFNPLSVEEDNDDSVKRRAEGASLPETSVWRIQGEAIELSPPVPFNPYYCIEVDADATKKNATEFEYNKHETAEVCDGQSMGLTEAIEPSPPVPFNPYLVEDDDDNAVAMENVTYHAVKFAANMLHQVRNLSSISEDNAVENANVPTPDMPEVNTSVRQSQSNMRIREKILCRIESDTSEGARSSCYQSRMQGEESESRLRHYDEYYDEANQRHRRLHSLSDDDSSSTASSESTASGAGSGLMAIDLEANQPEQPLMLHPDSAKSFASRYLTWDSGLIALVLGVLCIVFAFAFFYSR